MKKPIYKRKWFIAVVIILALLIVAGGCFGGSDDTKDSSEPTKETTEATTEATEPESDTTVEDYNKQAAWRAVDQYCRENKDWSATEFRLDKVIIKDGQYYVYVKRDMADGSEGLFQYILEPSETKEDGTSDLFELIEDSSQVFEYVE